MHPQTHFEIRQTLIVYSTKGKKSVYKKKQIKRLIAIIDDIFKHEPISSLESIGKRQIIGYWKRHENESVKTRREKYSILVHFFRVSNPQVTVPEPKP